MVAIPATIVDPETSVVVPKLRRVAAPALIKVNLKLLPLDPLPITTGLSMGRVNVVNRVLAALPAPLIVLLIENGGAHL